MPTLVIDDETLNRGLAILKEAFQEVLANS